MSLTKSSIGTCFFTLEIKTSTSPEFVDITDLVNTCVDESGIGNGITVIFSQHTTASIIIQENEPLLLEDLANTLERIAPRSGHYRHNDFDVRTVHMHEDECPNGHSHCQHLILGASETIPLVNGSLSLGKFQRVFLVELDDQKASQVDHRKVLVQILGA